MFTPSLFYHHFTIIYCYHTVCSNEFHTRRVVCYSHFSFCSSRLRHVLPMIWIFELAPRAVCVGSSSSGWICPWIAKDVSRRPIWSMVFYYVLNEKFTGNFSSMCSTYLHRQNGVNNQSDTLNLFENVRGHRYSRNRLAKRDYRGQNSVFPCFQDHWRKYRSISEKMCISTVLYLA